jgi:hypothetical protein
MRSLDYARDDNLRGGALKNHCHSERYFVRPLDYARDDNLRGGALKNHCHSERHCMRPLNYARILFRGWPFRANAACRKTRAANGDASGKLLSQGVIVE